MDPRAFEIEAKRKKLTELFLDSVSGDKFWEQAQKLVMKDYNTTGPRYVISSFIYTRLIRALHNPQLEPSKDISYLMFNHTSKHQLELPAGWKVKGYKGIPHVFSDDGRLVSITTFKSFYHIRGGQATPKIGSYFDKVPFNIHGIAFDLQSNRLIGKEAIEGISEGVIRISNKEAAQHYASKRDGKDLNSLIVDNARKLGIRYE